PVTGTLANYGKNGITSFDINYSVDGGATVTKNITGVNIQGSGMGSYNFTADAYTPAAKGAKVIEVWASNLDGNADGLMGNDKMIGNFNVHLKVAPRISLHEVYSSSTCGPCAPGNVNHSNIISGKDEATFAVVKYQQDFPGTGDPYATKETVARRNYYAINSIPRMEIDGQWDGNGNSFTSAIHDQYQAIPSLIELSAKHNIVGQNVDVYVDMTPLADLPNAKLHIAICEKITDQNVKSNGESEFHHVVKKMLPTEAGTSVINLKENTLQTVNKSYNFPGVYRLPTNGQTANQIKLTTENSVEEWSDLEVIVWLQDLTTKKVLQTTHSVAWATAIKNTVSSTGVKAYPNPANGKLFLEFDLNKGGNVRFDVVNTLGQTVTTTETAGMGAGKNNQTLNTANLANGVYFVNINSNGAISTQRFVVAH
ncbi:MAG: T9SS type A sorting domain-containing protein, partial [Flavobacteriaceae bacterium]|nr:T9SS type A sorting domain-containing protein [Flavobacteriaceae bacterium]